MSEAKIMVLILVIFVGCVVLLGNSTPEAHVSTSTGECVKFVDSDGEHACPSGWEHGVYTRVWVK